MLRLLKPVIRYMHFSQFACIGLIDVVNGADIVFIFNSQQISHSIPVIPLLPLNKVISTALMLHKRILQRYGFSVFYFLSWIFYVNI